MPSSLRNLREQGISLQLTTQEDPLKAGFAPYRVAVYACGALAEPQNCLRLLNDFVQYGLQTSEPGDEGSGLSRFILGLHWDNGKENGNYR